MPAKENQDWTDDAAFWDDAWADMELRLEEEESPKGFLFWTRGSVLIVLLLIGIAAAWLLTDSTPRVPEFPESISTTVEEAPVATSNAGDIRNEMPGPNVMSEVEQFSSTAQQSPPSTAIPQLTTEAVKANTGLGGKRDKVTPTASPEFNNKQPAQGTEFPVVVRQATPPTDQLTDSPVITSGEMAQAKRNALPEARLSTSRATLSYDDDLPSLKIGQLQRRMPLFVEATGSLAQDRVTPGFSLGLGTVISPKGRINFPVSIRYRRDFMRLGQGNSGGANDEAVGLPTADMVNNAIEPLRLTIGTEGTALTTSGLELSTGIQYRVSPRLSFGANLRTEYLLSANGVINAIRDGENFEYTFNNRTASSLDLTGAFNNVSALNESSSGLSGNSAINRYRLRAGIQLKYRTFSDFSVVAGVTRIVTPTYGSDLLRVRPTQLQLGVQYRLR